MRRSSQTPNKLRTQFETTPYVSDTIQTDNSIPESLEAFCKKYIKNEKGEQFGFEGRDYIHDILNDTNDLLYIIKGRQVGASLIIAADIIHKAMLYPRTTHIYMTDTQPHARIFSKYRFALMLHDTGLLAHTSTQVIAENNKSKRNNPNKELVFEYLLPNRSLVLMQSNYGAFTQSRSIPADFIWLDECQSAELEQIGNLHSAMSRSKHGRLVMAGTTNTQGSVWEQKWRTSTMSEWENKQWVKYNEQSQVSGYLISQLMMPDMTDAKIAQMRALYSQQEWDTEVVGRFTTGLAQPLNISEARECYYKADMPVLPTRVNRETGKVIATMDLAGGESESAAYTVLTILQYETDTDMIHVLNSTRFKARRVNELISQISAIIDDYNPDHIVSDAGGNIVLLDMLSDKYHIHRFTSQGSISDMSTKIKYGEQSESRDTIAKHPMMALTIQRWHDQRIRVPDCVELMPWTIEHVTAEKAETVSPAGGTTPYTRYERMPNRQDDFLQTLLFGEAWIYSQHDENNPHNFKHHMSGPSRLRRNRGVFGKSFNKR